MLFDRPNGTDWQETMVRDKPRRQKTNQTSHTLSRAGAWVKVTMIPAAREGHARCFPAIGEDRLGRTEVVLLMVWAVSTNGHRKVTQTPNLMEGSDTM